MELLTVKEQVNSFEARVSDLQRQRHREKFVEETFKDLTEHPYFCADSSCAVMENESLEARGHQSEKEGCDSLGGIPSLGDGSISSYTMKIPL